MAASEFKGGTGVSPVNHGRDGHATSVRTEGRGRTVNEWKPRPGAPDNHWLDCLVGAAVAASTLSVSLDGATAPRRQKTNKRKRKKVSYL